MTSVLRMSSLYAPTLKEDPSEAEVASHRLLLRAGMIRKAASGIYTFLPLAQRVLHKISRIVREEMNGIGSQELLLPIVQPAELWLESGRWDVYGPELARLVDRHGRDFCLGPTHEEIITALVRNEVRSYRELPLSLYQVHTKFRDEVRPRFGLLRGREFIMKDAYSFHDSQESLQVHYDEMSGAYGRICDRIGLDWRAVEADSGQIGGSVTTEFMALAESGEADLVYCSCGWAANTEAAEALIAPRLSTAPEAHPALERVHTPGLTTIAQLSEAFNIPPSETVKTMVATTAPQDESPAGSLVFFCVPGDRDLNMLKAVSTVPGARLLADEEFSALRMPLGSLGPIGAPANTRVIADRSLESMTSWFVGANEEEYHLRGAVLGRDFSVEAFADLVTARAGDLCPSCGEPTEGARGIEVSQVFQLGTKYSQSMGATFTDEQGAEKPFIMGCYGVGVSRSLAAVIEQHNDDSGIIWPMSVAPLEVAVLPMIVDDDVIMPAAIRIAEELAGAGVEVIIDDRDERAGVKFNDADLIGWPLHLIIGKRGLAQGTVELKMRATGERLDVPLEGAASTIAGIVRAERARYEMC